MTIDKLIQKSYSLLVTLGLVIILLLYAAPAQAGGSQWTALGLTSGQIYALVIDPSTPDTLYAGNNGSSTTAGCLEVLTEVAPGHRSTPA